MECMKGQVFNLGYVKEQDLTLYYISEWEKITKPLQSITTLKAFLGFLGPIIPPGLKVLSSPG
jgi:hypothetical protein